MLRASDRQAVAHARPGPPPYAAPGWALVALFIVYGSASRFIGSAASPWGPYYVSLPDVLQNILLYLPFGCFGALALRRHSLAWRAAAIAALAGALSLLAESAQLFMIDRTASITDVAAGTLGAALGAWSSPVVARVADAAFERARGLGMAGSIFLRPLAAAVTALVVVAWWPFDITLDPDTVSARLAVVRADPWQWGLRIDLYSHAIRYALMTLLIAATLERLRTWDAALVATLGGLVLAMVLDAGQTIMGGYPAGLAHLGFQSAGCLVGGALFVMCGHAERHVPA